MRTLVLASILLIVGAVPASASCGGGPTALPPDGPRNPDTLPPWDNPDPPPPDPTPDPGPTEPPPKIPGTPAAPKAPANPGAAAPGSLSGRGAVSGRPRPRGVFGLAGSWNMWWELNREHLLGLRKGLPGRQVKSGGIDPMPAHREMVRTVLRDVVQSAAEPGLRAAALRALGRAGSDAEVPLFIAVLRSTDQPDAVLEGAAIGLGTVPRIEDPDHRNAVRKLYDDVIHSRLSMSPRSRQVAILALSLRAADDPALIRALGNRLGLKLGTDNDAAALLFACGLARDEMLAPFLLEAAATGKLGGKTLHDVARAHAVLGLPPVAGAEAVPVLTALVSGKDAGQHTRRSAALALGEVLRDGGVPKAPLEKARRAVLQVFDEDHDLLLKAYCAIAMGTAEEPFGLTELARKLERSNCSIVRPWAALALGLAARRLPDAEARGLRSFLVRQLGKARDSDLTAALMTALGICRAEEGRRPILTRARKEESDPEVRAPACLALGMLKGDDRPTDEALLRAIEDPAALVVEKAAIALGIMGRRDSARILVEELTRTRSRRLQSHLVIALGHLGGTPAINPLLKVLIDPSAKGTVRESAAAALGILVDPRRVDPLFEVDSMVNPYAFTVASQALAMVY